MSDKWKVLILDDEDSVRRIHQLQVQVAGYDRFEVFEASSWEMARDKFGDIRYDIIFCDHHMGGLNSLAVWKELQRLDLLPEKFYIVTGNYDVTPHPKMAGIIYKPDIDGIISALNPSQLPARKTVAA